MDTPADAAAGPAVPGALDARQARAHPAPRAAPPNG